MTAIERRDSIQMPEMLHKPVKVMLINMEGEADLSLHEPIGIEVIAAKVLDKAPTVSLEVYDAQPELVKTGKVDTDKLAEKVRKFANDQGVPLLLGIGVPIYSWEYTKSLLIKLEQDPPRSPMTIVLGNAIPTYTKPELIKGNFPDVKLVVGEGEEVFAHMAEDLIKGIDVEDSLNYVPPNLEENPLLLRILTGDIVDLGGSVKIEMSRGCDYGACTFCSRCFRGGKDYRTMPESKVVQEVRGLIADFNITRFELTDEEAFGDIEATKRLVSAMKSADLPRVPFAASLRASTLVRLSEEGLLGQLREIGLEKVFIGVEAGSDEYQKQISKGQTMTVVREAIDIAKASEMEIEIGFITFSWRMSFDMLRKNVEFLSEGNSDYVSGLFNFLAVRAGTLDEILLNRYVQQGKIKNYDPQKHFSINLAYYQEVPFLDEKVGRAFKEAMEFSGQDARLYYSLKSLLRSKSLTAGMQEKAQKLFLEMKNLQLSFLRHLVGVEVDNNLREKRYEIAQQVSDLFAQNQSGGTSEIVRREAGIFLSEELERKKAKGDHVGALAVCFDSRKRILLVRARDEEIWGFPGGGVKPGEDVEATAGRELREELGVEGVQIIEKLPVISKVGHNDKTTGQRPRLILHHFSAKLKGEIDIEKADHEIVDTLWLSADDILKGRVNVRDNVTEIVRLLVLKKNRDYCDIAE